MKFRIAYLFSLIISGCTNLAPSNNLPNVSIDNNFNSSKTHLSQKHTINLNEAHWKNYFLDPQLQNFIFRALNHNHDLKIAALNIVIANEQYGISKSNQIPKPRGGLSYQRNQSLTKFTSSQYQANLALENFEIDFFGRVKNLSTVALNQYLQTVEAKSSAKISIVRAVAKTYYQLQITKKQLHILKQQYAHYKKTLFIYKKLAEQGIISTSSFSNAQIVVSGIQTTIAQQKLIIKQSKNALSTLLGVSLEKLAIKDSSLDEEAFPKQSIFIDLPSNLLFNRPDVIQAEYQLSIEQANIGIARASLFPSIKITNQLGYSTSSLDSFIDSSNWAFGINIDIPIFNLNKRKKEVNIAKLNQQIAVENYQKTIRSAFQEVSDTLARKQFVEKQQQLTKLRLTQTKIITKTIQNAFSLNQASIEELISSQQNQLTMEQETLSVKLDKINNQIDLFMVLGGKL